MAVSRRLKPALVEACGRIVEADGRDIALSPTPALVQSDPGAVRAAVDHDRKSKTVLAAADAFATEDLAALDDAALRDRLRDIWGFGEWSSESVALRGFGRPSDIPRSVRRLREAVASRYGLDTGAADDEALDRLSAPYAPRQGYWAHYVRVWAFRQPLDR